MTITFVFTPIALQNAERGGFAPSEMLGSIPDMLSAGDSADAVRQIDAAYRSNGGWRDRAGLSLDMARGRLTYPGDAPMLLLASANLRRERILFFNGAWVVVMQTDGSFRTARID